MKQTPPRSLLAIFCLSVLLRLGAALYLGDIVDAPPLLMDQRSYHALGERLITGHGFSFDEGWYPFTQPDTPTAHWSFLYSLFVAAVYAIFGPHPLAVRIVQAIIGGVLLPWVVYRLGRRIFQSTPLEEKIRQRGLSADQLGLWAAGVAAIYFYFVLYAATLMTETYYMIALLGSLDGAIGLAAKPSVKRGLSLGLVLGTATLLRQSILPWLVVMFVWLGWSGYRSGQLRRTIGSAAVTVAVIGAMILPFTIRNYLVYHQFLLLNSNAGYAMYSAQHPKHGTDFQEFIGIPIPDELWGLNEAQMDKDLMRRGIGFVLADPGRYALLSLSRVVDYFEFWPTPDTALINNLGRVGSFGLMLPFMLYGLWLVVRLAGPRANGGWQRFLTTPLALVLLFAVFYSALHILTWAMPRYRLPVDTVVLPFAALALNQAAHALAKRIGGRKSVETTMPEKVN